MYRTAGSLAFAAALSVAFLWGSPTEAAAQTGTWRLVAINGQAPPVVTEDHSGCTEELLSGTLMIADDQTWTFEWRERDTCGNDVDEDNESRRGRYTLDGQTIRFTDSDGDPIRDDTDDPVGEIDVEDFGEGSVSAERLTVRLADGETELSFERQT